MAAFFGHHSGGAQFLNGRIFGFYISSLYRHGNCTFQRIFRVDVLGNQKRVFMF